MKFIYFVTFTSLCWIGAQATDTPAQNMCRSLHHVDVDAATSYQNSGCLLNCVIHGKLSQHYVNEGLACPQNPSGICHQGLCGVRSSLGHIDINFVSASLSTSANAYATACIQNSSVPMTLPVQNRASCLSCSSNVVTSTRTPLWNSVCAGSGKYLFSDQARVTFEVFDHHGTGNNVFLGGASITIPQMVNHGDNHKELHLALVGGNVAGQINARVTWTPVAV